MLVNLSIKILPEKNNLFIKKVLLFVIFSISLSFYSCSDDPSSIGADLLKNDYLNINEMDSYKDTLSQESSYLKRTLPMGSAYRILVGKTSDVEASTLINFYITLADSIKSSIKADSIEVLSSSVKFSRTYVFGDNSANYDFSIHQILSGWTEKKFTSDSLSMLSYDASDIGFNKILSDSTDKFNISNDLVRSWLKNASDSTGNNYGILINPSQSSQKIVGYNALVSGDSTEPMLTVVFKKLDSYTDTLMFTVNSDVSTVTGNIPSVSTTSLVLQSGLAIDAKLWFDVSKVPFNAVINDAKVTLNLDPSKTIIADTTNTILAGFVIDSSSVVLDSSVVITFSKSNNTLTGTITTYVQKWINSRVNQGMLLFSRGEITSVDIFNIYGSNAADSLKPRLHIIYTTKK